MHNALRFALALLLALSLTGCDIFDSDKEDPLPTVPDPRPFTGAIIEAQSAIVQNASCLLRVVGTWTGGRNPTTANWSSTNPRVPGTYSSGPVSGNASVFDITVPRGASPILEDVKLTLALTDTDGQTFTATATVSLVCPASAALPFGSEFAPLEVFLNRGAGQALQGAHLEQVLREMGR
jgi:hypothetical protein